MITDRLVIGDRVRVRGYGGVEAVLYVTGWTTEAVFVTNKDEWLRHVEGLSTLPAIGIPVEDVLDVVDEDTDADR